jgi:shikimate kinase
MRIALAGPMGAGKTTVGARLALRLGVPFVDLDGMIGDIPAIFAAEGEAGFRARERVAVRQASGGDGVLSLGGGTVVDPANRAALAEWRVFVLLARPDVLRARVGAGDGRPLAGDLDRVLRERAPIWPLAGELVDTSDRAPDDVVDDLMQRCGA